MNTSITENIELTNREKEIIRLIYKEYANMEIADELNISLHTVESHRRNIFKKTKVKNIVGLVKYAISHDLTY